MPNSSALFPLSYELSRDRFRQNLIAAKEGWPDAQLYSRRLDHPEDLTIDWISAPATRQSEKILILTTAEHGIEGYVGSAMMQLFIENDLQRLNPRNTGLLLVHTINPWGMKHMRRTNAHNVDLNRNFVLDSADLDASFNPQYRQLQSFFAPARPLPAIALARLQFAFGLARQALGVSAKTLRSAALLGQYHHQQGIHYGGDKFQEETRVLISLYRQAFQSADQLLHLDMHTGWGPRYQMSLINSYLEQQSSAELRQRFDYPQIVAATGDEFYAMRGDMIDYVYLLRKKEFPHKRLYATSFEFGTYGARLVDEIRSLRATIIDNQLYWHSAPSRRTQEWVAREFRELFYPQEKKWQAKALQDAHRAFNGILRAEGFIRTRWG